MIIYYKLTRNINILAIILKILIYYRQIIKIVKQQILQIFNKAAKKLIVIVINTLKIDINILIIQYIIYIDIPSIL